jgi:hypothetical protein
MLSFSFRGYSFMGWSTGSFRPVSVRRDYLGHWRAVWFGNRMRLGRR